MAALDTIFITVDAAHAGKDHYNQKRSLNRQAKRLPLHTVIYCYRVGSPSVQPEAR